MRSDEQEGQARLAAAACSITSAAPSIPMAGRSAAMSARRWRLLSVAIFFRNCLKPVACIAASRRINYAVGPQPFKVIQQLKVTAPRKNPAVAGFACAAAGSELVVRRQVEGA